MLVRMNRRQSADLRSLLAHGEYRKLEDHFNNTHTNIKVYACMEPACTRIFRRRFERNRHVYTFHYDKKVDGVDDEYQDEDEGEHQAEDLGDGGPDL